jgi:diguanylate cyclase (GGDEF)-like protein
VVAETVVKMPGGRTLPKVTVSIGIAPLKADEPPSALLKNADVAMYRAKQSGRNRVVLHES